VNEMTSYYLRIAKYFFSTGILAGFGVNFTN
jgi:hypothetical protein